MEPLLEALVLATGAAGEDRKVASHTASSSRKQSRPAPGSHGLFGLNATRTLARDAAVVPKGIGRVPKAFRSPRAWSGIA